MLNYFAALQCFAQKNEDNEWTKIVSPKKDFSFSLPSGFLINKELNKYQAFAAKDDLSISVTVNLDWEAKKSFELTRRYPVKPNSVVSSFELGDVIGDIYIYEAEKSYNLQVFAASSNEQYHFSCNVKSKDSSAFLKFLQFVKFDNQFLMKQPVAQAKDENTGAAFNSFKISPIIAEALKKKENDKVIVKNASASETVETEQSDPKSYSRRLIILKKPQPVYPGSAKTSGTEGNVKLKVLFLANGQIGEITVFDGSRKSFNESAVSAAKKIKFVPAEIDGKPVDTIRGIEYTFFVY